MVRAYQVESVVTGESAIDLVLPNKRRVEKRKKRKKDLVLPHKRRVGKRKGTDSKTPVTFVRGLLGQDFH